MCAYNLSWLSSDLQNQGQNLSLLSALLSALNTLSTNNPAAGRTWSQALQTLLGALEQDQKPVDLGQADWDALKTEWSGLRTALNNQLPAALQPLAYQLSKLLEAEPVPPSTSKGMLVYPLLAKQAQAGGATGVGALTFKTSASANVQANAVIEVLKQQPEWATALGYQPVPEKSFFRLGLLGNLGMNAAANAAPIWGSTGVNAGATATAHLDLCFNYPPSDYVGQALLKSLAQLPAPGDLPGMLTACQGGDFAVTSLDVSGTVNLSGSIQASSALVQTVAGAAASWSAVPLGKPVNIAAGLAAKFAASWALDGEQHLTLIKKDGKPVVKLARGINRSTGAAVDISASIGIDGIQAALDPVMSKILPSAEPLISKLGGLSDLRGLALTALNQKLGLTADDNWTHAAQALLDIATGGSTSKATLTLSNSLKKIVDDYTKAYLTQGATAVTSAQNLLQAQVSTLLAGIPFDTAALNTGFTAALGEVSQKINGEITALGARLDGLANSAATQIAQSLGLATADLQQFISDLQTQVSAATARLGNWLKSYDDARERISKAIEKIERNKLALEVAYAYQKKQSSTTLIEVGFLQDTPSARALYKSLWTGQLDNYAAQIKLCESDASAKEIQSLFGRTQQRQISTGFSLSVFDFINASSTSKVLDSITVNTDRDGKIIVARDAISLSSIVNYQGFVSESSLALNLEMLALKDSSPPFNAEFKGSGDSINKDHLKGFFGLLEKLNAVSYGSGSRISDFLFGGTAGSDAILTQANINGISTLDLNAWLRLLQTPADKVMAAVQESCLACLTAAVDTGAEHTGMGGSPASWIAYGLNYSGWSEQKFWSTMVPGAGPKDWIESLFLVPQNGVDAIVPGTQMKSSFRRLWEVRRIAYGAGKAWAAVVAEAALFEQLKNEVPAGTAATANTFDRLSKLSKSISQNFALAFQFDVPDALQPMKVSWRFLGLVLALHKLALPDQDHPFITKVETTAYGDTKARLFV